LQIFVRENAPKAVFSAFLALLASENRWRRRYYPPTDRTDRTDNTEADGRIIIKEHKKAQGGVEGSNKVNGPITDR